ncbi:YcgN family cysteine cluster protein [Sulfuricurvum sp.]|uniref:YcgN family cysteine cluster protein n=1 Tax=Sulfuricurvum sp. TaxID=2025608 RepID=UPI00262A2374|nr:YcgN family cysteine cluster protein [Sulfuricurvum sp.]MDD4884037.1 YcgN family cysteine cluster protein [Sulfuricurvum sp.]
MKQQETAPFWETKRLEELTTDEWEALCDGCGLCCLNRIQDEDDDDAPIHLTRVACHCYDIGAEQCSDYANRFEKVEGCMALNVARVAEYEWLPETCAYRRRYFGLPLPSWHPLISGERSSVRPFGMHAYNPILENDEIDLEDYIIDEDALKV